MESLYVAEVTTVAGRNGHAKSSDGILDLDVRLPKELGGSGGATNPEQLFAAGWSACFGSSLAFVASQKKIKTGEIKVTAKVGLVQKDGGYGLRANLLITIDGIEGETIETLVQAAKTVCAYSNATRGNVETVYQVEKVAHA